MDKVLLVNADAVAERIAIEEYVARDGASLEAREDIATAAAFRRLEPFRAADARIDASRAEIVGQRQPEPEGGAEACIGLHIAECDDSVGDDVGFEADDLRRGEGGTAPCALEAEIDAGFVLDSILNLKYLNSFS